MKKPINVPRVDQSKLEKIKSGEKTKTQIGGVSEKKNVIQGKDAKIHITEKQKKFEESGVTRKKRNYVMYESKLGTEKEKNMQILKEIKKPKPKPVEPRKEEKILIKKKQLQYLDNYQYHETKDIKDNDPAKVSIVTHQRLGDIVGGTYEVTTYQKQTMTDSGRGPKLYSSQTTKTTTRRNVAGQPTSKTTTTTNTNTTKPAAKLAARPASRPLAKPTSRPAAKPTAKPAARSTSPSPRGIPRGNPAANAAKTTKTTKTTTTRTTKTTQRSNSASRSNPAKPPSRNTKNDGKKYSSLTNIRSVPKNQPTSSSKRARSPPAGRTIATKITTTKTTSTRTQSAGRGRKK